MTEYGLSIIGYLVCAPRRSYTSSELAEQLHISSAAAGKILKLLTKDGYLDATRGIKGGYGINDRCLNASVFDVIQSIEGPIMPIDCMESVKKCSSAPYCKSKGTLLPIAMHLIDVLKKMPVKKMGSTTIQIQEAYLSFDKLEGVGKIEFIKGKKHE